MSTVRRFNACCPDCGRWACVCNVDAAPAPRVLHEDLQPWTPAHVRTGPPPAPIRERLAKLRAEIAAHLATVRRPAC